MFQLDTINRSISSWHEIWRNLSIERTPERLCQGKARAREFSVFQRLCSVGYFLVNVSVSFLVLSLPFLFPAEHPRIQSLRAPLQKMSKSSPIESSKILLTDSPDEIRSRLKSAVTDSIPGVSWDPTNRPGVATLLQIHSGYSGESVQVLADRFTGPKAIQDLKESCAEAVQSSLKGFREEFVRIRQEDGYLKERELEGARKAQEVAQEVMRQVRSVVGTD